MKPRKLALIERDLRALSPADQQTLTSLDYGLRSLTDQARGAMRRLLRDIAQEPGVVRVVAVARL